MPFGLKNAGATYQSVISVVFQDMLHDCIEGYVDDIVIKSREVNQHINDLRRVFLRYRRYNLRTNSLKCAFGVSFSKFLGFVVYRKGIDLDLTKPKVIQDMEPPKSVKLLKSFMGRDSYVRRVIPVLVDLSEQFHKVLKKDVSFK